MVQVYESQNTQALLNPFKGQGIIKTTKDQGEDPGMAKRKYCMDNTLMSYCSKLCCVTLYFRVKVVIKEYLHNIMRSFHNMKNLQSYKYLWVFEKCSTTWT